MDSNYVGFRRITLDTAAWVPTETPVVNCDPHDWDGRCLHLGADAFLEFENKVSITLGYEATVSNTDKSLPAGVGIRR